MRIVVLLIVSLELAHVGYTKKNSKFYWKRPNYAMPWLKGPNVCAVEEVSGSRKRYYSECMTYRPRQVCGKKTYIRFHCCTGFERTSPAAKGCQGVTPVENLMNTARDLYLKGFRKHVKQAGMTNMLQDGGAYTIFAPHNRAFNELPYKLRKQLSKKDNVTNLLLYHMVKDRYRSQDLINNMELPSLYKKGEKLKFNRYSNGIVTVNCARLILPNQPATNGFIHVTEKIVQPVQPKGSVMEILLNDGRFGELVTALIVTGLANRLRADGPFTMFAPTDAAFRNAPTEIVTRILNDKNTLEKLLKFHVLDEGICAAAILGPTSLRTLEGQKVNLSCDVNDRLTINDMPTTEVDIVGTNGIIHGIDSLLIPDSAKSLSHKISELNMQEFLEYAQGAGLSDLLSGKEQAGGNFTIFVPSAEAFSKLTSQQKRTLQTQRQAMRKVLNYHVVPGRLTTKQLRGETSLATGMKGDSANIQLKVYSKEFGVNGAKILNGDYDVVNGVVHVVDTVLFPPEGATIDKIKEDARLSTFLLMLQTSKLDEQLLKNDASFTVFAPTNEAFSQLENSFLERLMGDQATLQKFVKYHILNTPVYESAIKQKLSYRFQTQTRDWIRVKRDPDEKHVMINGKSRLIDSDVGGTNGVIQVVDKVFECPCIKGMVNEI